MPRKRRPRNFIDELFLCSAVALKVKKEMIKRTKGNWGDHNSLSTTPFEDACQSSFVTIDLNN
jgi:hypothetical protein